MSARLNAAGERSLIALLTDQRLLVIVFILFRVTLLLAYTPLATPQGERGLTVGGDVAYYYQLASLSERGFLPFDGWWSEFPPVPSLLITMLAALTSGYSAFALVFGALMLAADVGVLLMVRRIGTAVYNPGVGAALGWIYALMAAPVVFAWWNFEPLVALFLLFGLHALIAGRDGRAAALIALGGLIKFTPLTLLGAVWRYRARGRAVRATLIAAALFAAAYAPLMLNDAAMTVPSLTAQWNKSSYQTVWALIDGNYRTGNFGPAEERLDPANAAVQTGAPSVVPGWLRLAVAGVLGLFVFARTRRFDARGLVAFAAVTLILFFLQAHGWSPQWIVQLIPLILLAFPSRAGVVTCVLLTLLVFAEYPFLFLRTGDTGGEITGGLVGPFAALILARTALLAAVTVALYRVLRAPVAAGKA